jgi:hypothetical protein
MARSLLLTTIGTDGFLRWQLERAVRRLRQDDLDIYAEGGVSTLDYDELASAARDRGLRTLVSVGGDVCVTTSCDAVSIAHVWRSTLEATAGTTRRHTARDLTRIRTTGDVDRAQCCAARAGDAVNTDASECMRARNGHMCMHARVSLGVHDRADGPRGCARVGDQVDAQSGRRGGAGTDLASRCAFVFFRTRR